MKKLIGILAVALLFASCEKKNAQVAQPEPVTEEKTAETVEEKPVIYKFVNTADGLNVREKVGGNKVAFLKYDSRVEVLEKGEAAEIDGWSDNWYKIRTENGTEGYAYGAYLSDSLKDAARFRKIEMGNKAFEWLTSWEEKLASEINIDTNPYNIICGEDGNVMMDVREFDGFDLIFEATYDKEKDQRGTFLLGAVFYGDGKNYPDFMPFKLGDSIDKAKSILGEPDDHTQKAGGTYEIWEGVDCRATVSWQPEAEGVINSVKIEKSGW